MTTSTEQPARLTPAEVEQFSRDGYLLPQAPVFSADKFARLAAHFEDLLAEWQADPKMSSPEHMDTPHFLYPSLFEWLLDDEVLDVVEPILGPDIALFSSHFLCKPPAVGKRVPWHEDSAYWKGRVDPMQVVTVWLAIDPSTPENGCMRVIPGTHSGGYSQYNDVDNPQNSVFDTEIRPDQMDESKAVNCILKPNQCSLHDGRLVHGSNANTGAMRRCGYTMRYISAHSKVDNTKAPGFQVYMARGQDHAGNEYGDPRTVNQGWIDAHPHGYPRGH